MNMGKNQSLIIIISCYSFSANFPIFPSTQAEKQRQKREGIGGASKEGNVKGKRRRIEQNRKVKGEDGWQQKAPVEEGFDDAWGLL